MRKILELIMTRVEREFNSPFQCLTTEGRANPALDTTSLELETACQHETRSSVRSFTIFYFIIFFNRVWGKGDAFGTSVEAVGLRHNHLHIFINSRKEELCGRGVRETITKLN